MKRVVKIERCVGQDRAGVYENNKLVELHILPWSRKELPRSGQIYSGRIRHIETAIKAAFVDLGSHCDGFLNLKSGNTLTEGQKVVVRVTRAPEQDKGPILRLVENIPARDHLGRHHEGSLAEDLCRRFNDDLDTEYVDTGSLDAAFSIALERGFSIPGGGRLTLDHTRAMHVIDVDSHKWTGTNLDLNKHAADQIIMITRLLNLAGLFAVDFVSMKDKSASKALLAHIKNLSQSDVEPYIFAPLSRFCVCEFTRRKSGPSLKDLLLDRSGNGLSPEAQSLSGLVALEREGRAHPGHKLIMTLPTDAFRWANDNTSLWHPAMSDRLGQRFELREGEGLEVKPVIA